ncbi:hypothetical protein C1752_08719 [Acaryochloris thomasi RCC1774]|uniref:Isochorismate synthase n=1 Tax=Acaryochloris thomasi RCC1774 TaxID=1764569 RepID=A0A2W1JL72_9CYAN|nr:hypothetical protein [Acaryochloris thomasi]PZD70944.1 hypothetical protein C1752_08719 [Acaryochloris thomasi RCC1774]
MTTQRATHFSVQSVGEAARRLLQFVAQPALRIFGPTDDDYPEVGVQPYEGDPADQDMT